MLICNCLRIIQIVTFTLYSAKIYRKKSCFANGENAFYIDKEKRIRIVIGREEFSRKYLQE